MKRFTDSEIKYIESLLLEDIEKLERRIKTEKVIAHYLKFKYTVSKLITRCLDSGVEIEKNNDNYSYLYELIRNRENKVKKLCTSKRYSKRKREKIEGLLMDECALCERFEIKLLEYFAKTTKEPNNGESPFRTIAGGCS